MSPLTGRARNRWARLPGGVRNELLHLGELFVLCGFAVAQPVLDVMGKSPDFFLFRNAGRSDIVLFAIVAVLLPPLALWLLEFVVGLVSDRVRRGLHLVFVAGLLTIIAVEVLKDLVSLRDAALLAVAAVAGVGLAFAYAKRPALRLWLRYLTPAPLVFVALFLFTSPVSDLVTGGGAHAVALEGGGTNRPVVVLFLDEFPEKSLLDGQGNLDTRLYPNFARLAAGTTWYRNTTGVSPFTPNAMPAMLTGVYPRHSRAPAAAEFPDTLFTLLGSRYQTRAFETITALCPSNLCIRTSGAPGGLGTLLQDGTRLWRKLASPSGDTEDATQSLQEETLGQRQEREGEAPAPKSSSDLMFGFGQLTRNQPARFTDFLDSLNAASKSRKPTLNFLHLLMPHTPWRYQPSGRQYIGARRIQFANGVYPKGQTWPVELYKQRHLLQVAYTDRLIGELIDRLQKTGLWDKAVFVVTADHGCRFTPGKGNRSVSDDRSGIDQVGWVPLFLRAPGLPEGKINDDNVETIDVLPTIADLLDVKVPWKTDGVSVLDPTRRRGDRKSFYRHAGQPLNFSAKEWFPRVLDGFTDDLGNAAEGPEGLFEIGPYGSLVGRKVAELDTSGGSATGALEDPEATTHVVKGEMLPALVMGTLDDTSAVDGPFWVATAVNGTIGGLSDLYHEGRSRRFAAVNTDRLYHDGKNDVDVYLVTGDPSSPVLHPVELSED